MLIELGNRFESARRFDDAVQCYTTATVEKPMSSPGWVHLSELLLKSGLKSEASEVLTRAIRLAQDARPSTPSEAPTAISVSELESALGRALEAQERHDDAEVTLAIQTHNMERAGRNGGGEGGGGRGSQGGREREESVRRERGEGTN
jgi:hypothetical protein